MSKRMTVDMKLVPLAAALLVAFGGAYAQQGEEVKELISPNTGSVSMGVGVVSNANQTKRFGQYTGLNKDGSLQLGVEVVSRDEATGTWTSITGRDLGLDTRELNATVQKQGDWRIGVDYNEIVRNDPYVIHTGMTGIGSTTPTINLIKTPSGIGTPNATGSNAGLFLNTNPNGLVTPVNPASANDVSLQLKRTAIGIGGDKWISPSLQLEVNFRDEEKKGARMFGRVGLDSSDMGLRPTVGTTANPNGVWAMLLTPEPIDSSIKTIEAKLNFGRDKLGLTGGYYGSFYTNNVGSLSPSVPGVLNRGALWNGAAGGANTVQQLAQSAVALPPDNQAHQIFFSGTYAYSDTTRTNFKLSYTHATQDENFAGMGLTPAASAPASLGGVVDTTLAQIGLSTRPLKNLTVNATLRYEDRQDKTPVYVYNTNGVPPPSPVDPLNPNAGSALNGSTNWPSGSQTRTNAKVDGVYRMANGYSASLGVEWERKDTPLPPANTALFTGQVLLRSATDENGIRAALRKAMSETLNGSISAEYKERRGGGWFMTNGNVGNALIAFDPSSAALACSKATSGANIGKVTCSTIANKVLPDMYMDRDRTKLRANLDWDPSERLSVQAALEHGQDNYNRGLFPTVVSGTSGTTGTDAAKVIAATNAAVATQFIATTPGARVITNDSISLDSSYKLTDSWLLTGYWTHSENRWNVNKANLGDDTYNSTDTVGLGIKGKVSAALTLGADLTFANDVTTFHNVVATSASGNIAGLGATPGNYLPSITYTSTKVNLYGIYELDKKSAVRMNIAYQELKSDDWQWGYNGVPFTYSDNTTVSNPNQSVTFLGVAFVHKF